MQYGDIVFVLAECVSVNHLTQFKFILTYLHITVKVILCNLVTWPAIYTCSLFFKTLFEKNKTKRNQLLPCGYLLLLAGFSKWCRCNANPNKLHIVLMSIYIISSLASLTQCDPKVTEASQQSETVPGNLWDLPVTLARHRNVPKKLHPYFSLFCLCINWKKKVETEWSAFSYFCLVWVICNSNRAHYFLFSSLVAILQEHAPPEIDTFITSRLPYALSLSLLCHQAVCKYACAHNRGRANSAKIRVQI